MVIHKRDSVPTKILNKGVFTSPAPTFGKGIQLQPNINFDEIPIEEPKIKQSNDDKKLSLRDEYIRLGGTDKKILSATLKDISITDMRKYNALQQKINDKKEQYAANGGTEQRILESNNLSEITKALNEAIRQNNYRKKGC